jgi:hypothetical protein
MRHLTYIVCLLAIVSCNKSKNDAEDIQIPATILNEYTSSGACSSYCTSQIWLVKYNGQIYFGNDYSGMGCTIEMRKLYYTDGTGIDNTSDLFKKIAAEGKYERVLWQCFK